MTSCRSCTLGAFGSGPPPVPPTPASSLRGVEALGVLIGGLVAGAGFILRDTPKYKQTGDMILAGGVVLGSIFAALRVLHP